jgi:hypothetical protein
MKTDFNDPEARLRYLEQHGADAYNAAMAEWKKANTVETVNGYAIRQVHTALFGLAYLIDGLNRGHTTLEGAIAIANAAPTRHFVEVHSPMDQVFVGPFENQQAAEQYAQRLVLDRGFDAWPMTEMEMLASLAKFGELPIQAPEASR